MKATVKSHSVDYLEQVSGKEAVGSQQQQMEERIPKQSDRKQCHREHFFWVNGVLDKGE
jgi:hypothetical protein